MTKRNMLDVALIQILLVLVTSGCDQMTQQSAFPSSVGQGASAAAQASRSPESDPADQSQRYEMTITNGSEMPISPGAIYVTNSQSNVTEIGSQASSGFVTLCHTGNPSVFLGELKGMSQVIWENQTAGLIQPGQSISFQFEVQNPKTNSVHFAAMYGKTQDSCALVDLGNVSLSAIARNGDGAMSGVDQAVSTGTYTDPSVANKAACASLSSEVACLRALSTPISGPTSIRNFSAYLPSVLSFLENTYGSGPVQSLVLTHGIVNYSVHILK